MEFMVSYTINDPRVTLPRFLSGKRPTDTRLRGTTLARTPRFLACGGELRPGTR